MAARTHREIATRIVEVAHAFELNPRDLTAAVVERAREDRQYAEWATLSAIPDTAVTSIVADDEDAKYEEWSRLSGVSEAA